MSTMHAGLMGLLLAACVSFIAGFPMPTATCSWYAYDKNIATAGYCKTNDNFFIAISQEPTTYIGKALTRVYGRQYKCNAQTTAATCNAKAKALGCSWDGSTNTCNANEYYDWRWFTTHSYYEEAPSWMLCDNSPAKISMTCSKLGIDSAACAATKGCSFEKATGYCTAALLLKLTPAQRTQFYDKARAFNPVVVGSCPSICYLRQVTSCYNTFNMKPQDAATWCKSKPYCKWTADGSSGSCSANLYGSDAWGKVANQAAATCSNLSASNTTCLTKGPIGAVLQLARVEKYLNYPSAAAAARVACKL